MSEHVYKDVLVGIEPTVEKHILPLPMDRLNEGMWERM